jgi:N-acyl homoserine lactone hydrolase
VPIPVFLIEHPKGRVLFDTGLHADCQHNPAGRLGPRLAGLFRIGFQPGEEISARLEAIDRDPGKIDLIINSHFHFDHVGGNALIPNATMLVQRREWEAGMDPDTAARRGFNPRDFDLGHKSRLVDGEHDVFGDGSVVCQPTYGHTPGHQSLRLRLDRGEVVLAADACYFCQTLRERRLPRNMYDRESMLASLDRLEALEPASSSATTRSSGKRYRRHRSRPDKARTCSARRPDPHRVPAARGFRAPRIRRSRRGEVSASSVAASSFKAKTAIPCSMTKVLSLVALTKIDVYCLSMIKFLDVPSAFEHYKRVLGGKGPIETRARYDGDCLYVEHYHAHTGQFIIGGIFKKGGRRDPSAFLGLFSEPPSLRRI